MIGRRSRYKRFCPKDYKKIENYQIAVSSKESYHCHHKKEITLGLSSKQLIERNEYFDVPPEDLIFLTESEHLRIHREFDGQNKFKTGIDNPYYGKGIMTGVNGKDHPQYKQICPLLLCYLYKIENKTAQEIHLILGIGVKTVYRKLKEYNLQ